LKKRSKYRPRAVLRNPVAYVLESLTPIAAMDKYFIELKIKNHDALRSLTQGIAVRADIDTLIATVNITEALYRLGFGREYGDVVRDGLDALRAVGKRGIEMGKFILKAPEMSALNLAMELHDAQLEIITLKDMENAIKVVNEEYRQRKMRPIVEKVNE
jgi:uncharacterized membrane-anchored protein